jgi:hypothetical protein
MCLNIMGAVGIAIGALSLVFMKEPKRIEQSDECKIELESEQK